VLAGALALCVRLKMLDLSSNRVGDKGALALAGALAPCVQLQSLRLHNNNISNEGAAAVRAAVLDTCTVYV